MDEPNIYEDMSNESSRIIQESDKEMGEPMEQDDAEKARADRERRKNGRRAICPCGNRITARRKRTRRIVSQNPFIIFYLEMYYRTPDKHITEVAREAGKAWCAMSEEERKKYIQLAERERLRRRRRVTPGRKRQSIC